MFEEVNLITKIVSIIGGLPLMRELFNSYRKRKSRNLLNAIESQNLLNNFSDNFKNNFVQPDLEENYFFVQTGIRTSHEAITSYKELKSRLGYDFTWNDICLAKPHLKLKNTGFVVSLSRFDNIRRIGAISFAMILLVIGVGIQIFFAQYQVNTINDRVIVISSVIVPILLSFLLLYSVESETFARKIEKRLSKEAE